MALTATPNTVVSQTEEWMERDFDDGQMEVIHCLTTGNTGSSNPSQNGGSYFLDQL